MIKRKARKAHDCTICGAQILRGERYFAADSTGPTREKCCRNCMAARLAAGDEVISDDFYETIPKVVKALQFDGRNHAELIGWAQALGISGSWNAHTYRQEVSVRRKELDGRWGWQEIIKATDWVVVDGARLELVSDKEFRHRWSPCKSVAVEAEPDITNVTVVRRRGGTVVS